jgi:hypothetical protein
VLLKRQSFNRPEFGLNPAAGRAPGILVQDLKFTGTGVALMHR